MLDLADLPSWVLPSGAAAGGALTLATLYWIMPAGLRRTPTALSPVLGAALFVVAAWLSGWSRGVLWFAAVGWVALVPALLLLGRLPADLPSARDPRVYRHPQYAEFEARGRRAGYVMVALFGVIFIGTAALVRGL